MTSVTIEKRPLPTGAVAEVQKVANWLLSEDADFQTHDQIRICKNTTGLSTATSRLAELFTNDIKVCVTHILLA